MRVDSWFINVFLCIIGRYTEYSTICIALYSLLLLTIHRYFRMTRPARERESMTFARLVWIIGIWFGNIFFWFMLYLIINDFVLDASVCNITLEFYLVLALNFVLQIAPLGVLIFLNIILLKHIAENIKKYKGIKFKYLVNLKNSRYPNKLKKGLFLNLFLEISRKLKNVFHIM